MIDNKLNQELFRVIEELRNDIHVHQTETKNLRIFLKKCDLCRDVSLCNSIKPCYHGVSCTDYENGTYSCGTCPSGFRGDGRFCEKIPACTAKPCYRGVACQDTDDGGYFCGRCPEGFDGDGRDCREINGCDSSPCFRDVNCENLGRGKYNCGPCPNGFTGNGLVCLERPNRPCRRRPCFEGVVCEDLDGDIFRSNSFTSKRIFCISLCSPYRCGRCPEGYEGDGVQCRRVSICAKNPCFKGVECFDIGNENYRCGPCPTSYTGNGRECSK